MNYSQKVVIILSFLMFIVGGLFCVCPTGDILAIEEENNVQITLLYNGKSYVYDFEKNMPPINNFIVQRQVGKNNRLGTSQEKVEKIQEIEQVGYSRLDAFCYMFFGWDNFYKKIKNDIDCLPVDAMINFNPNKLPYFSVQQDKLGYQINDDALLGEIMTQLEHSNIVKLEINPKVLRPKILASELSKWTTKLASFSTNYEYSTVDRKHNVKTALSNFNGMRVEPMQVVSFNNTTGRRTAENGYREAKIIQDKEYIEAYGGGVCQSSTTLYNALLLSGMDILEVHPHSLPPSYINFAFDAMVNFGTSDLRFQNNTDAPIFIRTFCTDKSVNVEIYGKKQNNITIKRVTQIVGQIAPAKDKEIVDNNGEYANKIQYNDEYFYKVTPKVGYKAKGYLEFYSGDKLLNKKLIREVTYQSIQGIKIWGAKIRPIKKENEGQEDEKLEEIWSTLDNLLANN